MKGKILGLMIGLVIMLSNPSNAAQIRYNFTKGAIYSYTYTQQDISAAAAPIIAPRKTSDTQKVDFIIKTVGFQDNAFILDIGSPDATFRRYVSPNGSLKGAPAEDRSRLPFFIIFPEGDWKIGSSVTQNTEIFAFGKTTAKANRIEKRAPLAPIKIAEKVLLKIYVPRERRPLKIPPVKYRRRNSRLPMAFSRLSPKKKSPIMLERRCIIPP